MAHLWSCIVGPKLFRLYGAAGIAEEAQIYAPTLFEKCGNQVIQGLNVMWNIGVYTSPLIITYLYRREYFCWMGCVSISKFAAGMSLLLVVAFLIRGLGRFANPTYTTFLRALQSASAVSPPDKTLISQYDFDFSFWPVDFRWDEVEGDESRPRVYTERTVKRAQGGVLWWLANLPCELLSWCCAHFLGRHLIYPGSISLIQAALEQYLQAGREKLVLEHLGQRNKVFTRDGNYLDTMFVDRRKSVRHQNGSTLVVCCEGNAGFYEIGIMTTPLEAGYSVLGWNHPGFASSTGLPFPSQEQNAVDALMQFAIHKLGFQPESIIIYAWSIGGYVGTWAAMNYPQIRGLVLDASFDDILPLALPRMPNWMGGLVTRTIRQYFNLNNSDHLSRYSGPITVIRRTRDEIITTREYDLSTNRGNDLLIKLLKVRFPSLQCSQSADALRLFLSEEPAHQDTICRQWEVDEDACLALFTSYAAEHGPSYPMALGEDWADVEKTRMLLFLTRKHLVDFPSTHNNPLEVRYFRIPWMPFEDPSYVKVD